MIFIAFYFCTGMVGTWLGLVDFMTGKQIAKWDTTGPVAPGKDRDR
jgi:hypothetical protein